MKKTITKALPRPIMCGICLIPFVRINDEQLMGVCEHRSGVIANVPLAIKKVRKTKTNGSKQ